MSAPVSANPNSLSESQRAPVEEQLDRMLQNRHFSHSRRFPAFLRFVVEKTLAGSADQLKERTLGIEIFGRPADYDTSTDPIVRVTAAEIRKRIAQYYNEPEHEHELRISLDAGSYVPQFHWPKDKAAVAVPHVATPALTSTVPAHLAMGRTPDAVVVKARPRRRWLTVAVALAIMAGAAGWAATAWRSGHVSPIDYFWGPILHSSDPVLFCIVSRGQFTNLAVDAEDPTRQTVVKTSMSSVNLDDLSTIEKIGSVLLSHGKKHTLKGSEAVTLSDLRNGPTIFVGAFDNPWTMRLTKPLRFHFGNNSDFTQEWIADSRSGKAPEWFTTRPVLENANNYREYAIVARFTDPDTGQICVIAAGIGQGSTLAAGEFLTDPAHLEELQQIARAAGGKPNIEAVISTQIIDGQPGAPKIEATYFW